MIIARFNSGSLAAIANEAARSERTSGIVSNALINSISDDVQSVINFRIKRDNDASSISAIIPVMPKEAILNGKEN